MKEALALLANLRSRGIELNTDGARIRWRPAFLVNARLEKQILSYKADLIALLPSSTNGNVQNCPSCRWPLDSAMRCPKCFDRLCVCCGRPTGSYLIMTCVACGHGMGKNEDRHNSLVPE
jgi:hypothetical protein